MRGHWLWSTFLFFLLLSLTIIFLLGKAEKYAYLDAKNQKKYTKTGKLYYFFIFIILIVFCLIRNIDLYPKYPSLQTVDMQAYLYYFRSHNPVLWDWNAILSFNQSEPLFYTITWIIGAISLNHRFYWFVLYSFYIIAFLKFFSSTYKKSNYSFFYVLFIINLLYGMAALRSCIANAFCLFAFICMDKDKKLSAIILTFAAILCHYTAIFALPAILICWNKKIIEIKKKYFLLATLIAIIALLLIIPSINNYINTTKYAVYLNNPMSLIGQSPLIACGILCIIYYKRIKEFFPKRMPYVLCVLYNCTLIPLIVTFDISRVSDLFFYPRILVWITLMKCIETKFKKSSDKKIFIFFIFLLVLIYLIKALYDMRELGTMPYIFPFL